MVLRFECFLILWFYKYGLEQVFNLQGPGCFYCRICDLLWRYRSRPLAVVGIFVAFLVYYLLLLYHIGYLSLVIGTLLFP